MFPVYPPVAVAAVLAAAVLAVAAVPVAAAVLAVAAVPAVAAAHWMLPVMMKRTFPALICQWRM